MPLAVKERQLARQVKLSQPGQEVVRRVDGFDVLRRLFWRGRSRMGRGVCDVALLCRVFEPSSAVRCLRGYDAKRPDRFLGSSSFLAKEYE